MRDAKSRSDLGMYLKVHLFSMILLALITGCGKTKKSKSPTSNGTVTTTQVADGNWLGSCEADGAGKYKKSDFVVSGSSATSTIRTFSDANCVTEASVSVFSIRFVVGRPVATPAGAFEVEQTVSKIMMTLKTPEGVTMANEGLKWGEQVILPPTCNGGFTINEPKELNPTVCAGDLLSGALFTTSYGIVKVDGDKIYFGETDETNDGSTPAKRPTKLESSHYSKQPSGGEISLSGTWVGACEQDEDGSSSQSTLTFSGSSLTSTSGSYLDADCTQEEFVYVETGSFTVGNELSSPVGAFPYDLKIDQIIITYKTDERVTAVNADGGLCGQTVTKDVGLELDAADCSSDPKFSSFFSTAYDVVKVDGDKLSFGELTTTNDGSTAEKRPTALSTSYSVKQP